MNLQNNRQSNYWTPDEKQQEAVAHVPSTPVEQPAAMAPVAPQPTPEIAPPVDAYPAETYQPTDDNAEPAAPRPSKKPPVELPDDTPIAWVAKEYQMVAKSHLWYVGFAVAILGLMALAVLVFREWTFAVLIAVIAVVVVVYNHRPPQDVQYTLSAKQGLYIGERLYHLSQFKRFGLLQESGHNSIVLIPVKRFSPAVSVFFPDEVGERIVDILGQRLPMETIEHDLLDKFIKKIGL